MVSIEALSGLRALVVGLGREGIALAGYLAGHGLAVTGTDQQPAETFGDNLAALQVAGVHLTLGEHPLSLLDNTDILFVSPGIPLEVPFLVEAQARKIPLCTETKLFCLLCRAPIIGITGSNGKTTTTTLVGQILAADGRKAWVGGNIGRPLIERVDQIEADEVVVMELSSFQLEYFHSKLNQAVDVTTIPNVQPEILTELLGNWSPPISAILNITPNHLDRHPTMKHYVRAKRAIINYQGPQGRLIMNLDNDMTRTIGHQFGAKTRWFSLEAQLPGGASLTRKNLVLNDWDGQHHHLATIAEIKLRGNHNLSNILAACLLCEQLGVSHEAMHKVITSFTGVEHRLQFVRELNQVKYYNDSIATSPERLFAALRSFRETVVLLAGGHDKNLPWEDVSRMILHKASHVILFGEAAQLIASHVEAANEEMPNLNTTVHFCQSLADAVQLAAQVAQAGDVVLLSPGCASYDMFRDFVERGELFISLVKAL